MAPPLPPRVGDSDMPPRNLNRQTGESGLEGRTDEVRKGRFSEEQIIAILKEQGQRIRRRRAGG